MKQNKIIYLILLQLFICFNIYSQELIKDTFIDPRDNQTYGVVKFGNTKLFAEIYDIKQIHLGVLMMTH